ncbi:MAG: DUF3616 domain-containing protein [Deltaproteobacteria bacterium]|nr:DUF3616 domain-containing protein [Deltaproteobacteria bacterium]
MVGLLLAIGCAKSAEGLDGSCEPSALLQRGEQWIVGDNEQGRHLFVYDSRFKRQADLALPLDVDDIEALALDGSTLWVVGSHSTSKKGERRPGRERILRLDANPAVLTVDFAACPECVAARGEAPDKGGLNIEAAAVANGQLLLGLRGPMRGDKAILLVVDPTSGRVTESREVNLGGEAFRELVPWKSGFLAVSGPVADGGGAHHLWWWPSLDTAPTRRDATFPASTEAILPLEGEIVYLVDGDGKAGKCVTPAGVGRVNAALP